MEIWAAQQAAERLALGLSDGSLGGAGQFLWDHKGALAAGGYFAAALSVVPRLAFPRLALRIVEEARARGDFGGLEAYRLVPFSDSRAEAARAVAALVGMDLDPFHGAYLEFHSGEYTHCVVAGRNLRGALDALNAEYRSEASLQPIENLREVLADVPHERLRAGLRRVYRCYRPSEGAAEGLGTAALSEFGGQDPLDGALARIAGAVKAEKGEHAMVQIHLRPATDKAVENLKSSPERHMEHPEEGRRPGLARRMGESAVWNLFGEGGRDRVKELRDERRHRNLGAARQPKETDHSRHVAERADAARHFEIVAVRALGWVEPGRERGLASAFDAYFGRFGRERGGKGARFEGGAGGTVSTAAELRWPPPRRGRSARVSPVATPEEVAAMWHPLGGSVSVENKGESPLVTKPPSPRMPKEGITVARCNHPGSTAMVNIPFDAPQRHGRFTGSTDMGKTSCMFRVLSAMISEPAPNGKHRGVLLLDPQRTLFDPVLSTLPAHREENLLVVDLADDRYPAPAFNFLGPLDWLDPHDQASLVREAFVTRFPGGFKARNLSYLEKSLLTIIAANRRLGEARYTVCDLTETRFLAPRPADPDEPHPRFRAEVLSHLEDDPDWAELVEWWREQDCLSRGQQQEIFLSIWNKIQPFTAPKVRRIFGVPRVDLDPLGCLERGDLVLVNLDKGNLMGQTHALIGTMLVSLFYKAAGIRFSRAKSRGKAAEMAEFITFADEAQDFACDEMGEMLAQGRKLKAPLWVAHQHLGQLGEDLEEKFGLAGTRAYFRATDKDGPRVSRALPDSRFTAERLMAYPRHNFVLWSGGETVTCETVPIPDDDPVRAEELLRASAANVSRLREEKDGAGSVDNLEAMLEIPALEEVPAEAPAEEPGTEPGTEPSGRRAELREPRKEPPADERRTKGPRTTRETRDAEHTGPEVMRDLRAAWGASGPAEDSEGSGPVRPGSGDGPSGTRDRDRPPGEDAPGDDVKKVRKGPGPRRR